jgi:hypothetical protein
MNLAGEMQHLMVSLDVKRAREIWRKVAPHLHQPKSDEEMLTTLHLARTQSEVLNVKLRYYSHSWLNERGLPSLLPDPMRPAADRMYPRKVQSVGISVNSRSSLFRPIVGHIRGAMEDAVKEVYADGHASDIPLIKSRMTEARQGIVRKLLGVFKESDR